jgi:predicted oxidoreductase (fatty acid repression mutant protein)
MFFEDQSVVKNYEEKFPSYAKHFNTWATQSDAMLQFAIWTALEAEGLGANLQHYNPIIDEKVAKAWDVPQDWKLNAQLVFGGRTNEPSEKTFMPLEERYRVFGK